MPYVQGHLCQIKGSNISLALLLAPYLAQILGKCNEVVVFLVLIAEVDAWLFSIQGLSFFFCTCVSATIFQKYETFNLHYYFQAYLEGALETKLTIGVVIATCNKFYLDCIEKNAQAVILEEDELPKATKANGDAGLERDLHSCEMRLGGVKSIRQTLNDIGKVAKRVESKYCRYLLHLTLNRFKLPTFLHYFPGTHVKLTLIFL